MKSKLLLVFACGLAAVCAGRAADATKPSAQVTVTYVAPEKFADVKDDLSGSDRDRDRLLDELKAHFESVGRRYLAGGQTLEIKVTDVDLAGDFEPWHGIEFDHIRILKEIYPPRINLEFRLLDAQGKVLSEGKRHLQNLGYLMTIGMPTTDALRYDKDMISDWLRQEFKHAS
jgi:hypothetical protein